MQPIPRINPKLWAIAWCTLLVTAIIIAGYQQRFRALSSSTETLATRRLAKLPPVVLWAWERPEKLDYLDADKVGVAFLYQTLYLRGPRVIVRPRLQPLKLRAQQPVIAVTRIESEVRESPLLDQSQLDATVREIATSAHLANVVSVQIDFDAKKSERNFYRQLIFDLRPLLPDTTGLSITALASWCSGDNWLDDLPIDEAVPMLFRMGLEKQQILSQVRSNEEFRSYKCRQSTGISLDEPITDLRPGKRIYVFNPASWSESSVNLLLK